MDSISEVLVVSDSSNQDAHCFVYDLKTGSLLTTFKDKNSGSNSAKKGLSFIGQDFIISASDNKPLLRVWALVRSKAEMLKMIVPGKVSSLAVSSCGTYCAAGIDEQFYVWEVSMGVLMTSIQHHSKPISCIRFSSDGSHLITGGKDGMVLVWLLSELVSATEKADNPKPRYVWIDHAAEITDIYVGNLEMFSRVATASKDMSCKIYELETGILLTTVHLDYVVTAVSMDEAEYFLFLGSSEGKIDRINMFAANDTEMEYSSSDKKSAYLGHSKEVTCLSVSTTGINLVSGSEDHFCMVWDILSFACVRKIQFEGGVTNAFITLLPPGFKEESHYFPRVKVSAFKRNYVSDEEETYVLAGIQSRKLSVLHVGAPDNYFDRYLLNSSDESVKALNRNNLTQEKLSCINREIYSFALCEVYDQPEDNESQMDDSD